jgi:protease-4
MYADTIVASPVTITGSIGVIGGWFYNKSFDSNLGVSTDFVKKGEHADIGFGFTLPFLGLTLPDRDLNPKEQEIIESTIKSTYKEFVTKVAAGRKKSYNYIDSIGQGRIWSGTDGLKNGLVDILGGLSTAINIAALKAGIQGKDYKIKEYPNPGLIDFNKFLPHPFGFEVQSNKILDDLKFRFENNGKPLMMLPIDDMGLMKDTPLN